MLRHLFGILTFLSILLGTEIHCYGAQGFHIVTATNNIAVTYSASAPFLFTLVNPITKHMVVTNSCSSALAFSFTTTNNSTAPAASTTTNPGQIFAGPSTTTPLPFMGAAKYVWIRADTTACSTGDVVVDFY